MLQIYFVHKKCCKSLLVCFSVCFFLLFVCLFLTWVTHSVILNMCLFGFFVVVVVVGLFVFLILDFSKTMFFHEVNCCTGRKINIESTAHTSKRDIPCNFSWLQTLSAWSRCAACDDVEVCSFSNINNIEDKCKLNQLKFHYTCRTVWA